MDYKVTQGESNLNSVAFTEMNHSDFTWSDATQTGKTIDFQSISTGSGNPKKTAVNCDNNIQ